MCTEFIMYVPFLLLKKIKGFLICCSSPVIILSSIGFPDVAAILVFSRNSLYIEKKGLNAYISRVFKCLSWKL